jgi:hypothetical protein
MELSACRAIIHAVPGGDTGGSHGTGLLLWLLGIPLPIILLIWVFGGLHGLLPIRVTGDV